MRWRFTASSYTFFVRRQWGEDITIVAVDSNAALNHHEMKVRPMT